MTAPAARLAALAALLLFVALATTASAATTTVNIEVFSFGPPVTIDVGDVVTWTNKDSAQHSARVPGVGTTRALSQGQSASLTFTVPGTFNYDCGIHGSSMPGTVIVRAAATAPPTIAPTVAPTVAPTPVPTARPTVAPTVEPTPTASPAPSPTPSVAVLAPTQQAPAPGAANGDGASPLLLIGAAGVVLIALVAFALTRIKR